MQTNRDLESKYGHWILVVDSRSELQRKIQRTTEYDKNASPLPGKLINLIALSNCLLSLIPLPLEISLGWFLNSEI